VLVGTNLALVVSPVNNTLQAFSALTGTWATLSAVVQDTGAVISAAGNVGLVVSPVNNTLQAFSAQAGAWTTLSAVVQDTGAIALGGRVAGMDNN